LIFKKIDYNSNRYAIIDAERYIGDKNEISIKNGIEM
jgi:hypothetical protein